MCPEREKRVLKPQTCNEGWQTDRLSDRQAVRQTGHYSTAASVPSLYLEPSAIKAITSQHTERQTGFIHHESIRTHLNGASVTNSTFFYLNVKWESALHWCQRLWCVSSHQSCWFESRRLCCLKENGLLFWKAQRTDVGFFFFPETLMMSRLVGRLKKRNQFWNTHRPHYRTTFPISPSAPTSSNGH